MRRSTNLSKRSVKKKKSFLKRIPNLAIFLSTLVVFLFVVQVLFQNVISLYQLNQQKKILLENQQIVQELEKQLEFSKTPEFIEQYARENLDMLKSGEFVIIVRNE